MPRPNPVLKWAGGKRRLLPAFEEIFPSEFGNYFEPFFGGGAVFFWLFGRGALQRKSVTVNDINPELVNFYSVLVNDCEGLIEKLRQHSRSHSEKYYYKIRAMTQTRMQPTNRAARLMYLNRTCFNGLYRVNSKGQFNVPLGRYKNPRICDEQGLRAASAALAEVNFREGTYKDAVAKAKAGDLVYFDPPYVPLNPTSSFTSYTKENFGKRDQEELAATFSELAERGVKVLLSNSDTPLVRELFQDFKLHQLMAPRAINSKADRRQKVAELLVESP